MVEDRERTFARHLSTIKEEDTPENWAKIYHSLVLWGKLCSAVQWITYREKICVQNPGDIYYNKGHPVLEFFRLKHPGTCPPIASIFQAYRDKPPAFVTVDITDKTVASDTR